jgi:hypothetical protein
MSALLELVFEYMEFCMRICILTKSDFVKVLGFWIFFLFIFGKNFKQNPNQHHNFKYLLV